MKRRFGIARVSTETNVHCPVPTTLDDFRRHHWLEGEAILRACGPGGDEVPGYLRRAELAGALTEAARHADVEVVPLVSAWTLPGGPVSGESFAAIRRALRAHLAAAGPLDGILFVLHGAMAVVGVDEPEIALLGDARAALGPGRPLVGVFDLHAHLTPAKVGALDALLSYRTNPHRDHARVGADGMALLLRLARAEVTPAVAWRSLPMITGGGTTVDFLPTMWPVFRALRRARRTPGVLAASLFLCHPWSDAPDLGWATHVVTDGDPALADRVAESLADAAWAVRHVDPPPPLDAETAIARVRRAWIRRRLGCACLVDTSDVAGAGSPGDGTGLLHALLAHAQDLRSYVPLRDAVAVAALWDRPLGDEVELDVGARMTAQFAPPARVRGRVARRLDTTGFGRIVLLDLGAVQLALTEGLPFAIRPAFWSALGLSVWRADIVVVKSLFLWLPFFLPVVRLGYLVQTHGPTDFDALTRNARGGPVHPRDPLDDWRPEDRRRRSLTEAA